MRSCTITLALLAVVALALSACAPRQLYPTIPDMAEGDLSCKQLAHEMTVAKEHLTTVQIRRASVTTDDLAMFVGDFGQTSSVAGPLAEKVAQDRVDLISNRMVKKGCK